MIAFLLCISARHVRHSPCCLGSQVQWQRHEYLYSILPEKQVEAVFKILILQHILYWVVSQYSGRVGGCTLILEVWTSANRICSGFRVHSSLSCFLSPVYFSSIFSLNPKRTGVEPSSLMTRYGPAQDHQVTKSCSLQEDV